MGLFQFLRRLLFGDSSRPSASSRSSAHDQARDTSSDTRGTPASHRRVGAHERTGVDKKKKRRPKLTPLRWESDECKRTWHGEKILGAPYRFARLVVGHDSRYFYDFSRDGRPEILQKLGLPEFCTPDELAEWLEIPTGKLAWLVHRFHVDSRPESESTGHYHLVWKRKRTGAGWRLIEAPKQLLKHVQSRILREILDRVPVHPAAHGFVRGRSVISNARQHLGERVVVRLDLENFYPSVTFARVTAIFRRIGYCREAAIWLARLTTTCLPVNARFPEKDPTAILPYLRRRLPQGAPTSPALANLSAFSLDVRLSGLAKTFVAKYTRYADDLTFSGSPDFLRSLRTFLPLTHQIIRQEKFRVHHRKRRVMRNNQRQTVTGLVVNERLNVSRKEYDRLKAILTNCVRRGPDSQNRAGHEDFAAHLRGRIAHVQQANAARGAKLLAIYDRIQF